MVLDHHRGHAARDRATVATEDKGPGYHEATIIPESRSAWVQAEI
jgi:hypothetical protein